jgi:hypothetical protein
MDSRDALADELGRVYPAIETQLADLLRGIVGATSALCFCSRVLDRAPLPFFIGGCTLAISVCLISEWLLSPQHRRELSRW